MRFFFMRSSSKSSAPSRLPQAVCINVRYCFDELSWKEKIIIAYHIESDRCIHLDSTVKVPEKDGYREKQDIDWIANIVSEKLNKFADEHPHEKSTHCKDMWVMVPGLRGFIAKENKDHVTKKGRWWQGC